MANASGRVIDAKPEHYFRLRDGRVVKNLSELVEALRNMSDDVFRHHVNSDRNDFYNWIRDIFKDGVLAHRVRNSRTQQKMASVIEMYERKYY